MNEFKERIKFKSAEIKGNKLPPMYDMYDENGVYVGKINQNYEKMQNRWLKGICIFLETEQGKILMEHRGNTKLNPNEDDFCSGHVEENETYLQAAYREAREELGLMENDIKRLTLIGNETPLIFAGRKFLIQFLYGNIDSKKIKIDNKEVESYYQEEQEIAFQKLRDEKTKFPYKGNEEIFEEIIEKIKEEMNKSKKIIGIEK